MIFGLRWAMLFSVIHVFLGRAPYIKGTMSDFF